MSHENSDRRLMEIVNAEGFIGRFQPENSITFNVDVNKPIMKITRDGIWVDPTVEPTITAGQVLNVMDGYIKTLCQSVWNDAIDACVAHGAAPFILELKK
jgi:hypothetical protein